MSWMSPARDHHTGVLERPTPETRLLKMIVSNLLPLEITDETNFRSFLDALNHSKQPLPDKSKLCALLPIVYEKKIKAVQHSLASADDVVLSCELWSSRSDDPFLTVGCHFVDKLGKLNSYTLQTSSLFGDKNAGNIKSQLSGIMKAWQLTKKVHSVVRAGMPQLRKTRARFTHIPCFADSLNMILKDLLRSNKLPDVLRKCQNIVGFFKYDTEAAKMLRDARSSLNMGQDELIMYSGDRWLAWLHMLQPLLEQYQAVKMVLHKRDKKDWILNEEEEKNIRNLVSVLELLKKATSKMKAVGFETVSVMLPVLKTLMDTLTEEKDKHNDIAETLLSKCISDFVNVNKHKLAPITFLDPRYKNHLGDENKKLAIEKITQELTESTAASSLRFQEALDRYAAFKPTASLPNPLTWWRNTGKKKFGPLSQLALKKLGVVSTAVPLERAFSSAGDQFCDRRSSIEPEILNMMLFLNNNWIK